MKALKQPGRQVFVTAFVIWFVHFMASWTASEIWPHQWTANAVAWASTAIALLAVGVHFFQVKAQHAVGKLADWNYHFARGAVAIATVAVLFSALPSFVLLKLLNCQSVIPVYEREWCMPDNFHCSFRVFVIFYGNL